MWEELEPRNSAENAVDRTATGGSRCGDRMVRPEWELSGQGNNTVREGNRVVPNKYDAPGSVNPARSAPEGLVLGSEDRRARWERRERGREDRRRVGTLGGPEAKPQSCLLRMPGDTRPGRPGKIAPRLPFGAVDRSGGQTETSGRS